MSRVCVATSNTLKYQQAGHLWVYLNWALSFRARGFEVVWLDMVEPGDDVTKLDEQFASLQDHLRPFGLDRSICIVDAKGRPHPRLSHRPMPDVGGDLLFNARYNLPDDFPTKFRKSALLDTDPGMVQYAVRHAQMSLATHDAYLTVGNGRFDDDLVRTDLTWHPVLPAVALDHWPAMPSSGGAWSTVTHWYMDVWMVDADGTPYMNDKRTAFEPYLDLPKRIGQPIVLAANLNDDPEEQRRLEDLGWTIREAHDVGRSLTGYRDFIASSKGEFSCCKPSYRRLETGWISDRTACYLATGRPCVVEWSGPRADLGDDERCILRFQSRGEAVSALTGLAEDPAVSAPEARALAERLFDGRLWVDHVLNITGG
ncbi:MAG: hypothetical protein AAGI46_04960 [Planctomycetota bacterium]